MENLLSMNVQALSDKELRNISGGDWYMITEYDPCTGHTMRYYWNDETGECRNFLGGEGGPGEC